MDPILAETTNSPTSHPSKHDDNQTRLGLAQCLNHDALSTILIQWWDLSDGSPVTMGAVCRTWRETILATPQVWSRITIDRHSEPEYILAFLDRSRRLPLHIKIPQDATVRQLEALSGATNRMFCLNVFANCPILQCDFPILERLEVLRELDCPTRIAGIEGGENALSHSRFPRLRHLHAFIKVSVPRGGGLPSVDSRPYGTDIGSIMQLGTIGFPSLQKLEIVCKREGRWLDIIKGLSSTLVSLNLAIRGWAAPPPAYEFALPQLRYITISEPSRSVFYIDAPRLESVHERFRPVLVLNNSSNITHLHSRKFPLNLAAYPNLCTLWIDISFYSARDLEDLSVKIRNCPKMESVRYRFKHNVDVRQVMVDTFRAAGMDGLLQESEYSQLELPGYIPRSVRVYDFNFFRRF